MSYTLAELIEEFSQGRSLSVLAHDCGEVPSRSRIWQMTSGEMKSWPTPEIINGLADGLGVSPEAVVYASANSLGFKLHEPSKLAALLPAAAADLSTKQVAAVLAVVEAMVPGRAAGD